MNRETLGSIISLIIATCIFGTIIWFGTQDVEIALPDLKENLCPTDASLTKTNRVILFDFSDPIPEEYSDYPITMVDRIIKNEAEQFDRVILYTFNPYGPVPIRAADFCIPITMKNIPEEEKKVLWGKDPNIDSPLPARFTKYDVIIKQLWEHERSLNKTIKNMIIYLSNKGKNSQERSRLIENIEETVAIQKELGRQQTKITILSDMLQHTENYSHYKDDINFEYYLSKRESELLNMASFQFDIHYIQACKTVESKDRERHKNFWKDYFLFSGAQYNFNFLTVDTMGLLCGKIKKWRREQLTYKENKNIEENNLLEKKDENFINKDSYGADEQEILTDDNNKHAKEHEKEIEQYQENSSNINSYQINIPSDMLLYKGSSSDSSSDQEPAPETSNGFIQNLPQKN